VEGGEVLRVHYLRGLGKCWVGLGPRIHMKGRRLVGGVNGWSHWTNHM